ASLRFRGIETAADVTPERLKPLPDLTEAQAQQLLFWRAGMKRQFKPDPARGVQALDRINIEREMDNLKMQMEHELTRGAVYLQRMVQESASQQQQISLALPETYRLQAQAEKDWEVVQKQNPFWPLAMMLIIFFLYGCFISAVYDPPGWWGTPNTRFEYDPPPSTSSSDSSTASEPELLIDEPQAQMLFEKGEKLMKRGKFAAAAEQFQRSTELNPKYHLAFTKLGYALYRLGRYDESVITLNHSISLRNGFEPNYYLGQVYIAQEQWEAARSSFANAIDRSQDVRDPRFADSYNHWAQAIVELEQSDFLIEQLEHNLSVNPELTLDRFQLAALYVWGGKTDLALKHHRILKVKDALFANQLRRLMKEHARN
ncbi:MAG: tetratricopeptide repeat protein, partial [Acidobacteriota bacterium]